MLRMSNDLEILVAEDDAGHARLVEMNLRRAGLHNRIVRFQDGQEVVDFLAQQHDALPAIEKAFLLLLDIRMPKLDGVEVLRRIRENPALRKLPVTMLTTTEDPEEVNRCYELGCNNYVVKPVTYEAFCQAIQRLGSFLTLVEVPRIRM